MSKFNSYAVKVNTIAKDAFEKYRKAEAAYKRAEEQQRKYPQRQGIVDAEYAAKAARAYADFMTAKEDFKRAQAEFSGHNAEIAALRKQLVADLDAEYAADPAALDSNALELLKSGVLKTGEYARMMDKAQRDGNYTMARMVAKYAGDAATSAGKQYGENDARARELRAIAYRANDNNGSNTLAAFDLLADVYKRATNNPYMIDSWDDLTGKVAETM